jgi:L-asparaginase II
MGGVDLDDFPQGIDGCNVPVFGIPLVAMARAMARLATPDDLPAPRADAARRVVGAMLAYPYLVAGQGRFETLIMEASAKSVVVKSGAEGVFVAALPRSGLGIAVKIDDGAKRAAEVALAALLVRFGDLDQSARAVVEQFIERPIQNTANVSVGTIGVAEGWPT